MKKLLILIVAIAVYLHFYPNEQINEWASTQKNMVTDKFSEISDTKARVAPSKLLSVLHQDMKKFTKTEVAYVNEIVKNRDSLTQFYNDYCVIPKDNRRLRRAYQSKVCEAVDQYRIL